MNELKKLAQAMITRRSKYDEADGRWRGHHIYTFLDGNWIHLRITHQGPIKEEARLKRAFQVPHHAYRTTRPPNDGGWQGIWYEWQEPQVTTEQIAMFDLTQYDPKEEIYH